MKKPAFLLSLLLFTAATLVFAGSFQWKKVSSEQAHFEVEMPDLSEVRHDKGSDTWSVEDKSTNIGFLIIVDEKGGEFPSDPKEAQDALYKTVQGSLKVLSGKILNKRFFNFQGDSSIEVKALCSVKGHKAFVIERMVVAPKEFYVLIYMAVPSRYNPKDAEKYFDSLQMI